MNTPQSYLEARLKTCSRYEFTNLDQEILEKEGIESYLFKKLTSKKFRRSKLPLTCEQRIKKAISQAVSSGKPLQIVFPAGAYKLWSLPSSPEADWAEFFTLAHILSFFAPVLSAYKPGVQLHFYLFTYLMQKSNNMSADEVEKYLKSFLVDTLALLLSLPVMYYASRRDVLGFYLKGADASRSYLPKPVDAVSYTHLTLPTIYSV